MSVRVPDSTADLRCRVLPMRGPGNGGYTEEQLIAPVTRESIIGTQRRGAHPASVRANPSP